MNTRVIRWSFATSLLMVSAGAGQVPPMPQSTAHGLVNVPGARLYYEIFGEGDPILVVHGGPGLDHNYLLPGMRALANSHRVIFYDQRGSGATLGDVNASTISFDQTLADIAALVDSLHLGRITLLGHSWGGLVAMRYAARHPERLRSLILMNTVEPGHRYAERSSTMLRARQSAADSAAIAAIMASDAMRRQDTSAVNALLRVVFRSSFTDTSLAPQLSIHLSERSATNMSRVAGLVMGPLGRTFDLWPEAASIRVPTLIVHGVDDLVPLEMPRELARTIPGARLVEIQGSGHFPYIERPRETFSAIDDFLRGSARSSETSETVVLTYHAKAGAESELTRVLAEHWNEATRLNLVLPQPHVLMRTSEPGRATDFVEVFTWRDASIPDHAPDAIRAAWTKMNRLVEPRAGHPGIEFLPVTVVK